MEPWLHEWPTTKVGSKLIRGSTWHNPDSAKIQVWNFSMVVFSFEEELSKGETPSGSKIF